jgi:hypothetical protein
MMMKKRRKRKKSNEEEVVKETEELKITNTADQAEEWLSAIDENIEKILYSDGSKKIK